MKIDFLKQNRSKNLKLFVAGWGMDESIISANWCEDDLVVAHTHMSLDFDESAFRAYESVEVIGWSFGVWVAGFMSQKIKNIKSLTAINGTLKPVDEKYGINPAIFRATLEVLSDESLEKFYDKMKGDEEFAPTNRAFDSKKEELEAFAKHFEIPLQVEFDRVFMGRKDRIIPFKSQRNFWGEKGEVVDICHYDKDFFEKVING